jgi:hypothetical protein
MASQDALRRKKAGITNPSGTVLTSPLGDVQAGRNVVTQALKSGPSVGVRLQ